MKVAVSVNRNQIFFAIHKFYAPESLILRNFVLVGGYRFFFLI